MSTHLIYRQVLDVTFPTKKEAMDGQNQLSQFYRHELTRLINEVFDDLVPDDKHLRVDRLELDLGRLNPHSFEDDFRHKLRSQLEDELLKNLQKAQITTHPGNTDSYEGSSSKSQTDFSNEPQTSSPGNRTLELFTFFVKTGQLPWWAGRSEFESLESIVANLADDQPKQLLAVLEKLLQSDTYSRRLILQLPDSQLANFVALKLSFSGSSKTTDIEQILTLHEDLFRIHRRSPLVSLASSNFRMFIWHTAFRYWMLDDLPKTSSPGFSIIAADSNSKPSLIKHPGKEPRKKLFQLLPKSPLQSYLIVLLKSLADQLEEQVIASKKKTATATTLQDKFVHLIQLLVENMHDARGQNNLLKKMLSEITSLSPAEFRQTFSDVQPVKTPAKSKSQRSESEQQEATKLLLDQDYFEIQNAGLVIIAPFLPRFFDALGLVSEKEFVTDEAAIRGALLLQYIATGQTKMPEHELILNKILCGLPVDEPLPSVLEINDREKEESENLLHSVVEHWEALKGTSIDGLRQTFLIKDGLLSIEENGWKLRVERTTVDVLLDRLSWSISIIKLPWNDDMLHVEW